MFKIAARTVLELGSELISSDTIAFYELIKNAVDAGSPSGAEIRFEITLRRNKYLKFLSDLDTDSANIDNIKGEIIAALEPTAPAEAKQRFEAELDASKNRKELRIALERAYSGENSIIISDEGTGMSLEEIEENFLVIGTPSRRKAVDLALSEARSRSTRAPYLGEKGIGRLSSMRLGDSLKVETARKEDSHLNLLQIDWASFKNLDAMLDQIDISPQVGSLKQDPGWSGTRLTIGSVAADWHYDRVKRIAENDFARLTDPFGDLKHRPRIAVFWNGTRVTIAHMDRRLLEHAHAFIKGTFRYIDDSPVLECHLQALNLGFKHPPEIEKRRFIKADLEGAITGTSGDVPISALEDLGPFEFEAYWFNRQRLTRIDGIGEQKAVRDLQRRWSGIMLFRDGFRVLPYGEDEDDWLALDRRALASTGYLLNKSQFVGRVTVSRLGNQHLVDQTNREGLRVCPEQQAFVGLLQLAIQSQLRDFLKDVDRRYKNQPIDVSGAKTKVGDFENRAKVALSKILKIAPQSSPLLNELKDVFSGIKECFQQAESRISEVESEKRQMIQMAGVGLLVEVVAHELARTTENALAALEALRGKALPDQTVALLESLRSEMTAVNKRIRVLDPLSVSGRHRKEVFNLKDLIEDILNGHDSKFKRHKILVKINAESKPVKIRAVKGMIIQIIENLISNSVYWLEIRKQNERGFEPQITISIKDDPVQLEFEDNGRGIAFENKEKVFHAFFSLKEKSKRRGLGLFIARDCAEYQGGDLFLDDQVNPETGRLNRFILLLPEEIRVK